MAMDTEVSLHLNSFCVTVILEYCLMYTNQIEASFSYNVILVHTFLSSYATSKWY